MKKILTYIFYIYRSFKNSLKLYLNKKNQRILMPNFLIDNVIYIDPNKIKYIQSIPFKFYGETDLIMSFNWDLKKKTVSSEEDSDYKFLIWNSFYKNPQNKRKIFHEYKKLYDKNKEQKYEDYLANKTSLFYSIKKKGLKKNSNNNIQFIIDRNFNLVKINSGDHRFFISRILNLKKVPIEIKLIHTKCVEKNFDFKKINILIKKIQMKYI